MRKGFSISILFLILVTAARADIKDNVEASFSKFMSNLIPGQGLTEASLDLRENYKPDFSILAVRELQKSDNGNYFTQFSLFNTEKNNDGRLV